MSSRNSITVAAIFVAIGVAQLGFVSMGRSRPSKQALTKEEPHPSSKPEIVVSYCVKCKWQLRAAWMAQEILSTFEQDLGSVALRPSLEGGTYLIATSDGSKVIWDRKVEKRFPEAKEMKRRIRDLILPDKELGSCLEGKK